MAALLSLSIIPSLIGAAALAGAADAGESGKDRDLRQPTGLTTLAAGTKTGGQRAASAANPEAVTKIWVDTLNGGKQSVHLNEIWRIRPAFASDEPRGSTVIDFAESRLFVANTMADLVEKLQGVALPLAEFTAPNGQHIYLVATKVTDIFKARQSCHHPNTKTIVGTRDGEQQVQETQEMAARIIETAKSGR